jgi:Concanavalin A-like lectin/glucanases superfamily/IPT/TIG domain
MLADLSPEILMKLCTLGFCVLAVLPVCRAQAPGMLGFTSVDGYVHVPHSSALVPLNALTVEAWIYYDPSAPGGGNRPTVIRKSQWSHSYVLVKHSGTNWPLEFICSTSGQGLNTLYAPGPLPQLTWLHVAGTYDGSMMRMFWNGVQVSSMPASGTVNGDPNFLQLGQGGSNSETWQGKIDEIRLWSFARTGEQILSTMNKRIDNKPGLVAAWHFDGDYLDYTGGHNGTAVGPGVGIVPSTSPVLPIYLQANPIAPIGSSLPYELFNQPPPKPYLMDVSVTGTTPGTPLPPPAVGTFPLNPPFLNSLYGGLLPGVFVNFAGLTSNLGLGAPIVNLPNEPALIGMTLSAAFVGIDPSFPYSIGAISNPVSTLITAPAPVITSVTPPTGPAAGGWPVTVNGSNFLPGAQVSFAGNLATNVSVVSPTAITCTTPAGLLGPCTVQVAHADGNSAMLPSAFTYVPTLTLAAANPLIASPGALVQVTGTGIQTGATVTAGGIAVTPTSLSATSILFTAPAGVPCNAAVVVTNPDTQLAATPFNPGPFITSLINGAGPVAGGGTMFILGSYFLAGTTVTIGGNLATIQFLSDTAILVAVPAGAMPGYAPIVVTSVAGCTASSSYLYQ